jgi:hypothetical protein
MAPLPRAVSHQARWVTVNAPGPSGTSGSSVTATVYVGSLYEHWEASHIGELLMRTVPLSPFTFAYYSPMVVSNMDSQKHALVSRWPENAHGPHQNAAAL